MAQSNFHIQGRPTQYLFFPTTTGQLIRVTSDGLAAECESHLIEFMRWAECSALTANAQFITALSVARSYAGNAGFELQEESVHFD